jgi:hypothetical protein
MTFPKTIKVLSGTLLYFAFVIVVPIPACLHLPFAVACGMVNLGLAFAWAAIIAED